MLRDLTDEHKDHHFNDFTKREMKPSLPAMRPFHARNETVIEGKETSHVAVTGTVQDYSFGWQGYGLCGRQRCEFASRHCHTTHCSSNTISSVSFHQWHILEHSSDLAPSDFHLFGPVKKLLGGRRYRMLSSEWNIESQIFKLVTRWDKCIHSLRGYVEN